MYINQLHTTISRSNNTVQQMLTRRKQIKSNWKLEGRVGKRRGSIQKYCSAIASNIKIAICYFFNIETLTAILSTNKTELPFSSQDITRTVKYLNSRYKVLNVDKFGPLNSTKFVIVVQIFLLSFDQWQSLETEIVHDRVNYLNYLIDSLRNCEEIDKALVIFSHDCLLSQINLLIKEIKFCNVSVHLRCSFLNNIYCLTLYKFFSRLAFSKFIQQKLFNQNLVMQIFYPYSIQWYRDCFPGPDSGNCILQGNESNLKAQIVLTDLTETCHCCCLFILLFSSEKVRRSGIQGQYGRHRDAKLAQIKHHWWWKVLKFYKFSEFYKRHTMNYVFDNIMKKFGLLNTPLLILEEDHYVSPDLLYMMDLITKQKQKHVWNTIIAEMTTTKYCLQCQVIVLGHYREIERKPSQLGRHLWYSSDHNIGMVFDRTAWSQVKNFFYSLTALKETFYCLFLQTLVFCEYDDYNWDWSLMRVNQECFRSKWETITVTLPRVMHIGDCGVHTQRCGTQNSSQEVIRMYYDILPELFPKTLVVAEKPAILKEPSAPNGGWSDIRDHQLCLQNSIAYSLTVSISNQGLVITRGNINVQVKSEVGVQCTDC
ncbi:unnamed protein product [Enterobius vermicularis]|uniref:Alpha-1,6-mannosyl-glycoprotein 2-beta-N-acetylglucosaminyltransferase n=1 Tax=Enterobius vermicularis TaxID=51028 RepID=A0A0N4USH0_ENTVE|nr:unnamed protein product [Enterobius vermicularis]